MSVKLMGRIGAVLGAIVLLVSLAANPLGIGNNPAEFGWLQMLGAVLGTLGLAVGIWLNSTPGWALTVLGIIVLLVSLAANPLGIGTNPAEFGWLQTVGAVLGLLGLAAGIWLNSTPGRTLTALGVIVLLASLAANPLGIGTNPAEFGWLQMLGAVFGCLAIAGGLWLGMRGK